MAKTSSVLCSSSPQEVFLSFECDMAVWLVFTNRKWQKWYWAKSEPRPKGSWCFRSCILEPWDFHVNKSGLAWWMMRDTQPICHSSWSADSLLIPHISTLKLAGNWTQMYKSFQGQQMTSSWVQPKLPIHRIMSKINGFETTKF